MSFSITLNFRKQKTNTIFIYLFIYLPVIILEFTLDLFYMGSVPVIFIQKPKKFLIS
jgi:hypothetical protein